MTGLRFLTDLLRCGDRHAKGREARRVHTSQTHTQTDGEFFAARHCVRHARLRIDRFRIKKMTSTESSGSSAVLPTEIATSISNFEDALGNVEKLIATMQAEPWQNVCGPNTPPLDSARLHLMIAYAANSLFWIYLRTQGAQVQNHPVKTELERIKVALRKVKEAETAAAAATDNGDGADEAIKQKSHSNVNAAAAHRFVTAALGVSSSAADGAASKDAPSPASAGGDGGGSGSKRKEKRGKGGTNDGGSGKKRKKS